MASKQRNDPELRVLNRLGISVHVSRAAGLVLAMDTACLLLPMCRNLMRWLRATPLHPWLGDAVAMHRWTACSMLVFTLVHVNAHYANFFGVERTLPALGRAWQLHYATWAGVTGHAMLLAMFLIYTATLRRIRNRCYELFWYTHHLFGVFYAALFLHAFGCFVKSADTAQCKGYHSNYFTVPVFCVYLLERVVRMYRARQPTQVTAIVHHAGNTLELRLEKQGNAVLRAHAVQDEPGHHAG